MLKRKARGTPSFFQPMQVLSRLFAMAQKDGQSESHDACVSCLV